MKVTFGYVTEIEPVTQKRICPSLLLLGEVDLERRKMFINAVLTPHQKIVVIAHELTHILIVRLFWRVQDRNEACLLTRFGYFLDRVLDDFSQRIARQRWGMVSGL